ncbi:MAG: monovalent cation/H(+) antiporter subunit G [Eubacteriales bacterium]|nr:monovalent cation/H(+) antiporter subunit G [Eubacteriales bacterium]
MDIHTVISAVLIGVGTIFLWIAAVGIVRFPDFYSRLHAGGIGDTLGALLITLGIMVKTGLTLLSVKVFIVFLIYLITNPLGTNLIILEAVHAKDYQGYNRKVLRKKNPRSEKGDESHADA